MCKMGPVEQGRRLGKPRTRIDKKFPEGKNGACALL